MCPACPVIHHGSVVGFPFARAFAGNCPNADVSPLPVTPSGSAADGDSAPLVYPHDSVPLPDGTHAAPLLSASSASGLNAFHCPL